MCPSCGLDLNGVSCHGSEMLTFIKICGLNEEAGVDAALEAGADALGFVFFAPSPRCVSPDRAADLAARARGRAEIVALIVNADDALIAEIAATLRPDLFQLHGAEMPARVAAIKAQTRTPVMKAIGIAGAGDMAACAAYDGAAERLLLDAKPPRGATRPGGNGAPFDWSLLTRFAPAKPWILSGGLDAGNVAAALAMSGAPGVDVSSGVERGPGHKDPALIGAFVAAVRDAERAPLRRAV